MPRLTRRKILAFLLAALCGLLALTACNKRIHVAFRAAASPTGAAATADASLTFAAAGLLPSSTPPPPVSPTLTPLPPSATYTATLQPSATITLTPSPSDTPRRGTPPTRTRTITLTRTVTLTPTPPFAYLRLTRPGLLSKVVSPIRVEAMITPGDDGLVHIELIGEDGRLIADREYNFWNRLKQRFIFTPVVEFSLTAVVETARLVLSVDDLYGRKIALSSVDLLLLSVGSNEINPPVSLLEPYLIRQPRPDQVIEGGVLLVEALANPVNDRPLILELIDERGKIVGSTQIQVEPPGGDLSHTPFVVDISYEVSETTPVRLTLRQESAGRIPGTVALSSRTIILEP